MNRRTFIGTGALAGAGALIAAETGCAPKSVEVEIGILQSSIIALKPLLPAQATLLDKIGKLAGDFNTSYKAGNFTSAKDFFNSLADNIDVLISDVGGATPRVQFLVALAGVAIRAVAALLNEQGTTQPAAGAMATSLSPDTVNRVQQLGGADAAARMLQSVKQ